MRGCLFLISSLFIVAIVCCVAQFGFRVFRFDHTPENAASFIHSFRFGVFSGEMASSSQDPIQISDDEVFRRKLLMDGDGMGDERRLTLLLRSFFSWCDNKNDSDEQIVLGYEGLLSALDNCELLMSKSHQVQLANKREIENYEKLESQIEKNIAEMQETILKKKEELKRAKKIREQKQKYDALARIITQLPDRKETEEKLKVLNEEIEALDESKKQLESKIESRHKELQVLLNAAATLKETIKEEEASEMD